MKKGFILWMGVVLMMVVGMSSCNSDDDEIFGTGLTKQPVTIAKTEKIIINK